MSWSQYTDKIVADTPADICAFIALENGAVWGQTGVTISAEEGVKLVDLINNEATQQNAAMTGVHIGGEKYMYVNNTDGTINLKKSSGGAILTKSKKLLVILAWKPSDKTISNAEVFKAAVNAAGKMAEKGY